MGCNELDGELDRFVRIEALSVREPDGELAGPNPPPYLIEEFGDWFAQGRHLDLDGAVRLAVELVEAH